MLKFIKGHVDSVAGIEIFPIISFAIFFTFFIVLLLYVYRMKKLDLDEISALPLDDDQPLKPEKL